MKKADLSNPIALAKIIANSNANSIAVNATGTSYASQEEGFPHITMIPEDNGGEAPHGLDFNGFLKMLSSHVFNIQNGTPETFNAAVSSAIGGYPKNALLWLIDDNNSRLLKSTKDDNTDNFLTTPSVIGTSWVNALPTQDYVDDTFVTKATAQTITGAKTFTSNVTQSSGAPREILKNTDCVKGTAPSNNETMAVQFMDKNSVLLGTVQTNYETTKKVTTQLRAYKAHSASDTDSVSIGVGYTVDGNRYSWAPTPNLSSSDSSYSEQIVTVGWINGSNSNLVHRTGDEEISGTKTFKASPAVNISQPKFRLQSSTITKGTAPASDTELGWYNFEDNAGRSMGRLRYYYNQDKSSAIQMTAYQANSSGDSNSASIRVVYPASGGSYATAPASDVNGSILTTVNKSKSSNGYYKLGNGLIIQWFSIGTGTNFSVTFPTPFSSATSYSVASGTMYNSGGETWALNIKNRTSTGFTGLLDGRYNGAMCIAIGY